jgi:hypothetical protein
MVMRNSTHLKKLEEEKKKIEGPLRKRIQELESGLSDAQQKESGARQQVETILSSLQGDLSVIKTFLQGVSIKKPEDIDPIRRVLPRCSEQIAKLTIPDQKDVDLVEQLVQSLHKLFSIVENPDWYDLAKEKELLPPALRTELEQILLVLEGYRRTLEWYQNLVLDSFQKTTTLNQDTRGHPLFSYAKELSDRIAVINQFKDQLLSRITAMMNSGQEIISFQRLLREFVEQLEQFIRLHKSFSEDLARVDATFLVGKDKIFAADKAVEALAHRLVVLSEEIAAERQTRDGSEEGLMALAEKQINRYFELGYLTRDLQSEFLAALQRMQAAGIERIWATEEYGPGGRSMSITLFDRWDLSVKNFINYDLHLIYPNINPRIFDDFLGDICRIMSLAQGYEAEAITITNECADTIANLRRIYIRKGVPETEKRLGELQALLLKKYSWTRIDQDNDPTRKRFDARNWTVDQKKRWDHQEYGAIIQLQSFKLPPVYPSNKEWISKKFYLEYFNAMKHSFMDSIDHPFAKYHFDYETDPTKAAQEYSLRDILRPLVDAENALLAPAKKR